MIVWKCIFSKFLTPWKVLENKYFQILVDKSENILHITDPTPWNLTKKIFQTVWKCIFSKFLTPWKVLENKYFQILLDKRAFFRFSRTFTKIFGYFPWNSKFWNVDNIENWKSSEFTLKIVRKLKILTLSHRKVLVLEV